MRILITGGAGYIGSHTVLELLTAGHEVCVLDNFSNSSPESLTRVAQLAQRATPQLVEGDICDAACLAGVFASFRPEAVIHFAGLKAVAESQADPLRYYKMNVGGSLCLLGAMRDAGCNRLVFSSSATVYGAAQYLPYDEAHPLAPTNPYGRSKLMTEQIIRDWCAADAGASAVILRYFNPVGAHASGRIGESPTGRPDNLMPFICQVAVGRRPELVIFGADYDTRDGTGERDYIHVVDLARAHAAALPLVRTGRGAEVFNIGAGTGITVQEMVTAFERVSGRSVPCRIAARRPGDVARSIADPARAGAILNWRAELGPDEMCRSAWAWQSANPDGYRGNG